MQVQYQERNDFYKNTCRCALVYYVKFIVKIDGVFKNYFRVGGRTKTVYNNKTIKFRRVFMLSLIMKTRNHRPTQKYFRSYARLLTNLFTSDVE